MIFGKRPRPRLSLACLMLVVAGSAVLIRALPVPWAMRPSYTPPPPDEDGLDAFLESHSHFGFEDLEYHNRRVISWKLRYGHDLTDDEYQ